MKKPERNRTRKNNIYETAALMCTIIDIKTARHGWAKVRSETGTWFLSLKTIRKKNLVTGLKISGQKLTEIATSDQLPAAKADTGKYLSRCEKSSTALENYLKRRGYLSHIVSEVLSWAQEYRMVDDLRFARMYVDSRLSGIPAGKPVLIMELLKKGINSDLVEKAVQERYSEEKASERLVHILKRRYSNLPKNIAVKRMYAFLSRRGFSYEKSKLMISEALDG